MLFSDMNEKRFESDIEAALLSPAGGYEKGAGVYDAKLGLYVGVLIDFIQRTQPKAWARFENANRVDPVRKFCAAFESACGLYGLVHVLRHGFKHRGIAFRVCYFRPESSLNQTAAALYAANRVEVYRQWYYSADSRKSVDMVIAVNGIPVFAFELKNQYTGQTVDNLVSDLIFISEFRPHMVGMGPFIPHNETPFKNEPAGSLEDTLHLLSIVRLMLPEVLLPATTALGTLVPTGRELGILAGANVVMPNLSPVSVRKKYML